MLRKLFVSFFFFIIFFSAYGQDQISDHAETGLLKQSISFDKIRWNGYVRNFFYFRNMDEMYPDTRGGDIYYAISGGYREPLLRVTGRTKFSPKVGLEFEYTFDNLMHGQGVYAQLGREALPLQTLKFGGDYNSSYGRFRFSAGGIFWHKLTAFTFDGFRPRDDLFERLPWEGDSRAFTRYSKYYHYSNLDDSPDSRLGASAMQGVIAEGINLPYNIGAAALFGKTSFSGGYQSYMARSPKLVQSYRVFKKFGAHHTGLNFHHSWGETDRFLRQNEDIKIFSTDLAFVFSGIDIISEIGKGTYENPVEGKISGGAVKVSASLTSARFHIPVTVQAYSIHPDFVNPNSAILNTSVASLSQTFGDSTQMNTYQGVITDIGQYANNRTGLNLIANKNFGGLKIIAANGISREIENRFNAVTFTHKINKVTRSRFNFFQTGVGPYDRITNVYLASFERIAITDTLAGYRKGFNNFELTLKYHRWLFNRQIIFSNFTNYNTVQDRISLIPVKKEDAFITYFYNEFMIFYNFRPRWTLVGLISGQRVQGNQRTELAENAKPVDQVGHGYGIGVDIDIRDRAGLYLRQKWFSHYDRNFLLDRFSGYETGIEFKIFF